ncbi:NfeD family protein [Algoriphagus sp.]|uniref:NfeD family protein n=1 Tax=Algoriphagus sp. TaxID=1872435 RepID=UPI0025DE5109|nr:NfeD family protein [Algoriphagus sp.]
MTIIILSTLLLIGLILMVAEVLFVPGTTIVGVFGLIVSLVGIVYAFLSFDTGTAWLISGVAVLLNLTAIVYSFRSGVWNKFSLKETNEGGAFDGRIIGLQVGMPGKATSDIKPIGKAMIGEKIYEVKSESGFIPVGTEIIIIKILNNKIIVK